MEIKHKLNVFLVEELCAFCRSEMRPTGISFLSMPPQYQHRCSNGHTETFYKKYPTIQYETEDGYVVN